ncbi:unnamed protein product [Polarella glacialis]|uniref:Fatty acid desaturase domain-containing protein n=1 Tax=Polarella glacialis TaxID=89957 RepID=A0A813JIZ4_POLGL|nr:unnamed protein product [Polarella glacialis]CAE8681265.1 unnamed protein product [Polarella glacialis]
MRSLPICLWIVCSLLGILGTTVITKCTMVAPGVRTHRTDNDFLGLASSQRRCTKTVLMYWCRDLRSAICDPSCSGRLRGFFAIFVKFTLLLHLPLNGLVGFVFSLVININYFVLLAHGLPVRTTTDDLLLKQLRTSIDIFPHSYVGLFLSGALSNHGVHHVFPSLPRSLHKWGSDKLRKFFPDEYRVIDNCSQLFALWVLRDQQPEETVLMKDIVKKAEGYYCKKLILDLVSVVILCAVVAFLPPVRITEYIPSIKQQH